MLPGSVRTIFRAYGGFPTSNAPLSLPKGADSRITSAVRPPRAFVLNIQRPPLSQWQLHFYVRSQGQVVKQLFFNASTVLQVWLWDSTDLFCPITCPDIMQKRSSQKTYIKMRFPIISRCIQTKVEDNYRIKITFHHSFQRLKGSVKRLKQICNFCLIRDAVNRFFSLKKSIRVRKQ